jgi:asparagine N-glycosylation enzyme membrane subunit Stt3
MNFSTLTPVEQSGNNTVEVSIYAKNYWALVLLLLCVMVVFGNVLVILSVARERSLQNITNLFIVSLAVADLCVAGVVMPFYTYTMVRRCFIKKILYLFLPVLPGWLETGV